MNDIVSLRSCTVKFEQNINVDSFIKKSDIKYITLMFMYIFYFRLQRVPVLSLLDSTLIVGMYLIISYIISYEFRNEFSKMLGKKSMIKLLLSCVGLMFLATIITSIHGQFEFSICKPLFHQLLFLIIGFMFYAYLKSKHKQHKIIEYIIIAYSFQSIIQYAAFLMPKVNEFTDMFKTEDIIILKQQYDGFRLNAISGGLAFSLAGAYAIVVTIMIYRWNEVKIKHKFITLCLLLAGSLTAGRTALLLIFIAMILYSIFGKHRSPVNLKKNTVLFIVLSPIILIGIVLILRYIFRQLSDAFLSKLGTISYWLTKWKTEYFRVGNESNYDFWSTNYGVINNIKNKFLGDGIYTNSDGTYYLKQDAGYVRMLGFGGVIWIFAMFMHQLKFFKFKGKRLFESIVLIFLMLIGTLKADCIGIDLQIILILTLLIQLNADEIQYNTIYNKII